MDKKNPIGSVLQTLVVLVVLGLVLWNIYTGATIQEIGIPGIFMVKFGDQTKSNAPAPPAPGPQIIVEAKPNPLIIPPGGDVEIVVHAAAKDGTNIADADVTMLSGGGYFEKSGAPEVHGMTNNVGNFHVLWHAKGNLPAKFVMEVNVNKPGFEPARALIDVQVNAP
jgi:hypothetical protein